MSSCVIITDSRLYILIWCCDRRKKTLQVPSRKIILIVYYFGGWSKKLFSFPLKIGSKHCEIAERVKCLSKIYNGNCLLFLTCMVPNFTSIIFRSRHLARQAVVMLNYKIMCLYLKILKGACILYKIKLLYKFNYNLLIVIKIYDNFE